MIQELLIERELTKRAAKGSFWVYCRVVDDEEFYHDDNWHLRVFCELLQAFYERRLTKQVFEAVVEEHAPMWFLFTESYEEMLEQLEDDRTYTALMINIPPRTGKSRTLAHFCSWALGRNKKEQIMTASYNDKLAAEFSRNTRDEVDRPREDPLDIVFGDIFPGSRIQRGQGANESWALEGGYSSYNGVGLQGSATGKGATIRLIDDPIKDASEAFNATRLDVIWSWYANTYTSRASPGMLEIINHTRWSKNDLCGRSLALPNAKKWFVFKMQGYYEEADEMLSDRILPRDMYEDLKITQMPEIHEANYNQRPVDIKGRLYSAFKTYDELPRDSSGNLAIERIGAYVDTADTGADYLCSIVYGVYQGQGYVLDVLYTKDGMEKTEPLTARQFVEYRVNVADIEANNGGQGFARNVERIMWEEFKSRETQVKPFTQSKNKVSRILSNSTNVMGNLYFPVNWRDRFPKYYEDMTDYQKEGKNKHDDAPDATTGVVEHLTTASPIQIGWA